MPACVALVMLRLGDSNGGFDGAYKSPELTVGSWMEGCEAWC